MTVLASFCLLFALLRWHCCLLLRLQRRQRGVLEELTRRCTASRWADRSVAAVDLDTDQSEIAALVTFVNHLLTRGWPGRQRGPARTARIGERTGRSAA